MRKLRLNSIKNSAYFRGNTKVKERARKEMLLGGVFGEENNGNDSIILRALPIF